MYLLDSNAFMEANRLYYAFDIAPGFWDWLGQKSQGGEVASVDAVRNEITAGTGDLVDWALAQPASFWLADTADAVTAMRQLSGWATDPAHQFRQDAIDGFLDSADYKLIAHAMATPATLVTREQPAPDSKKKIKIPDVCNAFDVTWTDPFSLYRTLGLRLTV